MVNDNKSAIPDFPADEVEIFSDKSRGFFWHESRSRVIDYLITKYYPAGGASFIELGCGTGNILDYLQHHSGIKYFTGMDSSSGMLSIAKRRLNNVKLIRNDITKIKSDKKYDIAGAFDVLEHIDNDDQVIANIYRMLKPGGLAIISVPQHPWLWSQLDAQLYHRRRYRKSQLVQQLGKAGFTVIYGTGFGFFLLPLLFVKRAIDRLRLKIFATEPDTFKEELSVSPAVNSVLRLIFSLDEFCIRRGISLPAGSSLFLVVRKS